MKKTNNSLEEIKPDLKHDTMEYAASTDGDDVMEVDSNAAEREDESITAEELDILEDAPMDEQALALNSVEMDRQAADDVIFDQNDNEENYEDENDEEEQQRNN